MNTTDNGRTEARSRANRRLRRMTIGTTMLGVAATGSIGWLAAATYDGASAAGTRDRDRVRRERAGRRPRRRRQRRRRPPRRGTDRLDDHGERPRVQRRLLTCSSRPTGGRSGTGVRLVVLDGDLAAARAEVERVLAEVDLRLQPLPPGLRADGRERRGRPHRHRRPAPRSRHRGRARGRALAPAAPSIPRSGRAMRLIGYDVDFDLLRAGQAARAPARGRSRLVCRRVRRGAPHGARAQRASSWTSGRPARASPPTSPPAAALTAAGSGCGRPRQPGRRHRDGGPGARGRLADPDRRRQRDLPGRRWRADRDRARRRRHVEHDRAPLAIG